MADEKPKFQPTVCVDFDGVLCSYDGWKGVENFGDPIPGAKEFLESLKGKGLRIVIYTTRCCPSVNGYEGTLDWAKGLVENWLEEHGMPYDEIWTERGKPLAVAMVDDRGVRCQPQKDPQAFGKALRQVSFLVDEEN